MFDLDEFFQTSGVTLHLHDLAVHWERKTSKIVAVHYDKSRTGYDPTTAHHFEERAQNVDAFAAIAKAWVEEQPR